jgi:RimJ/RimL family protein N-acetyltransferase
MVGYGFNELGVHRIWSWCIADNVRSVRVLERLGLRPEGRLREKEYFKGRGWDHLVFGMLEDEWRANNTEEAG